LEIPFKTIRTREWMHLVITLKVEEFQEEIGGAKINIMKAKIESDIDELNSLEFFTLATNLKKCDTVKIL